MTTGVDSPGLRPSQVFDRLDDVQAERILPDGAFRLLAVIDPERIRGPSRSVTLGEILSLDLAVADPKRRTLLLNAVPENKIGELEERADTTVDCLREADSIAPSVQRALVGFFGGSTSAERADTPVASSASVVPNRGLFPHQKRAAAAVERFLYREDGPRDVAPANRRRKNPYGYERGRVPPPFSRKRGLVIWFAATRELLEQAAAEFELTWQAVGDRQVECVRFWSDIIIHPSMR